MALLNENHGQTSGVLGMFGRLRSDFSAYRSRVAKQRQIHNELSSLSTRELNELGLSPYDISRIVREIR